MRCLVAGGAGFLGSHLCERLIAEGHDVVCYDSLVTGSLGNLQSLSTEGRFSFERKDVTTFIEVAGPLDWALHFASPASPVDYFRHPIHTLKLGSLATLNCLGLSKAKGAQFLLASTSEVYGDPLVHPQPESYWGNVNPVGVRSVYDEAKRFAEAATMAYYREHGVPVRIARIFNTYGPRMRQNDGRAIPAFVSQALAGVPMTVHGDGSQTRSLCYVDDTIEGFIRLMQADSAVGRPVNIGNPEEVSVLGLAERVRDAARSTSEIVFRERPQDDPQQRCPDPALASELLKWQPAIPLEEGLKRTLDWARQAWPPLERPAVDG